MSKPNAPQVGDIVYYRGERRGIVSSVEGNLCYLNHDKEDLFIWRFPGSDKQRMLSGQIAPENISPDGIHLNELHDWKTEES